MLVVTTPRANAQSYQIDCAILLCLSGGWPASVPCTRARAEFIRRITPWPVEPPLQIWRCPMSASYTVDPEASPKEQIYEVLLERDQTTPLQALPLDGDVNPNTEVGFYLADMSIRTIPTLEDEVASEAHPPLLGVASGVVTPLPDGFALQLVQNQADIDISGPEFNFVRSIRVFDVRFVRQWESGSDGECNRMAHVMMGSYGVQGDFSWSDSSVADLPEAYSGLERYGDHCPMLWHRSVFVEWRDYTGNYGYEQVTY
ncbi:MAG: hypothetical protein AAF683_03750 [Pseudomonadota bacterium]